MVPVGKRLKPAVDHDSATSTFRSPGTCEGLPGRFVSNPYLSEGDYPGCETNALRTSLGADVLVLVAKGGYPPHHRLHRG